MNRLFRRSAVVPVALALAAAGCGGDDGPTREEFAKQADQVCADLEKQTRSFSQTSPDSIDEIAQFTQKARSTAQDAIKRIGDLETPSGDAGEKAKEWQDAVTKSAEEDLIPALDEMEKAAKANDAQGVVRAAEELQKIDSSNVDKLAKEIGANGCAE
jgi:hypothetical protein